jgi:hypothetical protein
MGKYFSFRFLGKLNHDLNQQQKTKCVRFFNLNSRFPLKYFIQFDPNGLRKLEVFEEKLIESRKKN